LVFKAIDDVWKRPKRVWIATRQSRLLHSFDYLASEELTSANINPSRLCAEEIR